MKRALTLLLLGVPLIDGCKDAQAPSEPAGIALGHRIGDGVLSIAVGIGVACTGSELGLRYR
jgi:hypothetical protein